MRASEFAVTVKLHPSAKIEPITLNITTTAAEGQDVIYNANFDSLTRIIEKYTPYRFKVLRLVYLWDTVDGMIEDYGQSQIIFDCIDEGDTLEMPAPEHTCGHPCGTAGYCIVEDFDERNGVWCKHHWQFCEKSH